MISVRILIPHRNRETGQSRLCNTSGSETIPGTSKNWKYRRQDSIWTFSLFSPVRFEPITICSREYYPSSSQCYCTYMNYLKIYLLLNVIVPKSCNYY